jgi:hypothetical protein
LDQQQALSSPSSQVAPPQARVSLTPPVLLLEPLALEVDEPVVALELEVLEDEEVVVVALVVVVEVGEPVGLDVVVAPPAPVLP